MEQLSTIRQEISLLRDGIKEAHADTRFTNKYLYSKLSTNLKWILSRDSDAFRLTRRQSLYQTLKCIEIIEAPAIDPCCGLRTRCTVYRTKNRLPEILEDSMGPRILMVTPIGGMIKMKGSATSLTVINPQDWLRRLDNPWMKFNAEKYAIYNDGYLYFPNVNWKKVSVNALFLYDVSAFNGCGDKQTCVKFLDTKLFVPPTILAEALSKTLQELAGVDKRLPDQQLIDKRPQT